MGGSGSKIKNALKLSRYSIIDEPSVVFREEVTDRCLARPFLPLVPLFLSSESREPRSADRYLDWSEFRPRTRRLRGFLHRGEKSLNRRSYRRAPLIGERRRRRYSVWRGFAAAGRDKDPISTGRNRKCPPLLAPVRLFLSTISNKTPRGLRGSSAIRFTHPEKTRYFISFYIFFLSVRMKLFVI